METHTYKSQFTTKFEFLPTKLPQTHKFSIIHTHGLYSDPYGYKTEAVRSFCIENNIDFLRYELIGHASDINNYENADITIWKNQILEVIDDLIKGDVILIGSSLGGWLSLLAAEARPNRVKGMIGLAAAPDFMKEIYDKIPEAEKKNMEKSGKIEFVHNNISYLFTKKQFEAGKDNLMLNRKINITCPVHLLQGMKDASVDWRKALKISDCLESDKVTIKLLKTSTHRLSTDEDLKEICHSIQSFF